ncbi:MAG: PIN domain-containing protein [Thermoleophilia bacterium]|nr:PIN domain-containing protein [Thermoleophilia bacterium]
MTRYVGKVVIDPNVLASALLFGGAAQRVLDVARTGSLAGVTSLYILGEFRSVISRPTFGIPLVTAEALAFGISASPR